MGQGKTSSLKKDIYDSMLKDIIEGIYKQSEIINEKQLIEKYGVSKSPIRDALIELCNEGVLISHPRYGYEVVRINEKEIQDIINFRIMVESGCLREAAAYMSKEDIEELKNFSLTECCGDTEDATVLRHWENNSKFHLKLISYSGNEYCYNMVQKSIGVMTRAYAQWHWEKWGTISFRMTSEGHDKIIECLLAHDVDRAVEELQKDIASFVDIIYPNYGKRIFL